MANRWEYMHIPLFVQGTGSVRLPIEEWTAKLNDLGSNGWELIGEMKLPGTVPFLLLKRGS